MSYYVLKNNGNYKKIYPFTGQGQTDAQTELDTQIAADLSSYTSKYTDGQYTVSQVTVDANCKGIKLTTSNTVDNHGINVNKNDEIILSCWSVEQHDN